MSVELSPKGTYGAKRRKMPPWLRRVFYDVFSLAVRLAGIRVLTLTTIGAKSGRAHRVDLSYFPDGVDAFLIVASKGGSASHPACPFNMARNPDRIWIRIGKRTLHVQAASLKGDERNRAYQRIAAQVHAYTGYKEKTDRVIPVIRLEPIQEKTCRLKGIPAEAWRTRSDDG
jgi:deazaflavin-dependent oxidoreductase (nitroreductase family)